MAFRSTPTIFFSMPALPYVRDVQEARRPVWKQWTLLGGHLPPWELRRSGRGAGLSPCGGSAGWFWGGGAGALARAPLPSAGGGHVPPGHSPPPSIREQAPSLTAELQRGLCKLHAAFRYLQSRGTAARGFCRSERAYRECELPLHQLSKHPCPEWYPSIPSRMAMQLCFFLIEEWKSVCVWFCWGGKVILQIYPSHGNFYDSYHRSLSWRSSDFSHS